MDQGGQLIRQDDLGFVQLAALPFVHLIDLLERQESQHTQALEDVRVAHVPPVLIEIIGTGLIGIQPYGAFGGLAHLLALGIEQQGDGHGVRVLAQLFADQLGAGQHVAPLVIAAELHVDAVTLVELQEIVGLHDHVVELQEAESVLHPLLVASGPQHVVDGEMGADVPDKLDVIEVAEPVRVIDHHGLAFTELDEAAHLFFEAFTVMVDLFDCHHGTQVSPAGGISDHACAAADQSDRLVARHLQALHQQKGHEMAYMQGIRRRVKADIEFGPAVVDQIPDLVFARDLCQQAPCLQFFIDFHVLSNLSFCLYIWISHSTSDR